MESAVIQMDLEILRGRLEVVLHRVLEQGQPLTSLEVSC